MFDWISKIFSKSVSVAAPQKNYYGAGYGNGNQIPRVNPFVLLSLFKDIVYACSNIQAQAVAGATLRLYKYGGKSENLGFNQKRLTQLQKKNLSIEGEDVVEITDRSHQALNLFYSFNKLTTRFQGMWNTHLQGVNQGEAYWRLHTDIFMGIEYPTKIEILESVSVTPKLSDDNSEILYYEYGSGVNKIKIDCP